MIDFLQARRRALGIAAASAFALLLVSCGGGDAPTPPQFGTMVAFGASVTDTGNSCNLVPNTYCPPSPPYASGKNSNGALWIETVAGTLGASAKGSRFGGTNFTYAGARTGPVAGGATQLVPNMLAQMQQYLLSANFQSSPRTLFVIDAITFGNDVTDALALAGSNPNAPVTILTNAVTNIVTMLNTLYASGAREIVILNSTNLGLAPKVTRLGPVAVATATQLSATFNGALSQQIAGFKAIASGVNIYTVDIFALANQAAANPGSLGLTNGTAPCFNDTVTPPTVCTNPDQYFYWDDYHPTAAAHKQLAQRVLTAIGR